MGGSSAGSYLTDPTSPVPSHCASIVATSTLRVNCSSSFYFQDITQQQLCSLTAVHLVEVCARWHVYCAHRLCAEDMMTFDSKVSVPILSDRKLRIPFAQSIVREINVPTLQMGGGRGVGGYLHSF